RGRDGRTYARDRRAARPGAREPRAWPAGDADAGQPGHRGALHRQPATRRRHGGAVLDPPAARGTGGAAARVRPKPRVRLAGTGETAGFPREPPSLGARTTDRSVLRPRRWLHRWTRTRDRSAERVS